jgi:hypothetical protein
MKSPLNWFKTDEEFVGKCGKTISDFDKKHSHTSKAFDDADKMLEKVMKFH